MVCRYWVSRRSRLHAVRAGLVSVSRMIIKILVRDRETEYQ